MPDTVDFLGWVVRNFYADYFWSCTVDRREAPRWCPDWISPDNIFAELVGRAREALNMLTEANRPAEWTELIEAAFTRLTDDEKLLTSMFPGPFDDFLTTDPETGIREALTDVESTLDQASCLAEVPGFAAMAYASIPSEQAINNVARVATVGVNEPVADIVVELRYLKLAAHFALAGKSEAVAQAVINRCLVVARGTEASTEVTELFAVLMEACAVYRPARSYYEVVGEYAARFCLLVNSSEHLLKLDDIFDILVRPDLKLAQALGRARATIRTKRGQQVAC